MANGWIWSSRGRMWQSLAGEGVLEVAQTWKRTIVRSHCAEGISTCMLYSVVRIYYFFFCLPHQSMNLPEPTASVTMRGGLNTFVDLLNYL